MRVPVEIIIDGVVLALAAFPAKTHVYGCYTRMVKKRSVIGAVTQRADAPVSPLAKLLAHLCSAGIGNAQQMGAVPYGNMFLRIINVTGHAVEKALQRMRSGDAQKAPAVVIRVDVSYGVLLEFFNMGLQEFG